MRTFNRWFMGSICVVVLMAMGSLSQAGSLPRAPKQTFETPFTSVQGSTVTGTTSTNSVTTTFPGAVYEVTLSSGASSEFIVMFDSNACQGLTPSSTGLTAPAKQLGARIFFSSTSANTQVAFDPPLLFTQGLCVYDSATTGHAAITFEEGRGLSGN